MSKPCLEHTRAGSAAETRWVSRMSALHMSSHVRPMLALVATTATHENLLTIHDAFSEAAAVGTRGVRLRKQAGNGISRRHI